MKYGIRTMDEVEVCGKTVLLRLDLNQAINRKTGAFRDITRIKASVPTVAELSEKGAKLVLMAHQGSDVEYKNYYTTEPHAKVLSELLGKEVRFVPDVCGPTAIEAIRSLKNGEILLLDNVRFMAEEQTLFELNLHLTHAQQAETLLVRRLAPLADLNIGDAFAAAHRDQPSLCGFEQVLPSAMGRLFEKEYTVISDVMENPKRPCVFFLGGTKVNDAYQMIETALTRGYADKILTSGFVSAIFYLAKGVDLGPKALEEIRAVGCYDMVGKAKELLDRFGDRIVLPTDGACVIDGERIECRQDAMPTGYTWVDLGHETVAAYGEEIRNAGTVFLNGPAGIYEEELTSFGTRGILKAMTETEAFTVIGGGDSVSAANKFGYASGLDYVCTGGGALIRFLAGEELPVVKALRHGSLL